MPDTPLRMVAISAFCSTNTNGERSIESRCILAYISMRFLASSSFAALSTRSVSSLSWKWQRHAGSFTLEVSESSAL